MQYPVAIWEENGVFTAEIPSLPGVITEADTISQVEKSVKEAAAGWMEAELDAGRSIPEASPISEFRQDSAYKDCFWMLVDIDMEDLSDKTERVNISIPARVLRRLDFLAASYGTSRSGYLSRLVLCQPLKHKPC